MKGKLDQEDNCECNLTDVEYDIRQNGIQIAKVRHLVVLNGYHISDNLDKINQNKLEVDTRIDAVETDLEVSISNLKIDTEASIDSLKMDLQQNVADLESSINENRNLITDTMTRVDVSKNTDNVIDMTTLSMFSFRRWKPQSIPV